MRRPNNDHRLVQSAASPWSLSQIFMAAKLSNMLDQAVDAIQNKDIPSLQVFDGITPWGMLNRAVLQSTPTECYVAFLDPYGANLGGMMQTLPIDYRSDSISVKTNQSQECSAVKLFRDPYMQDVPGYSNPWRAQLESLLVDCVSQRKQLIFTGHASGGALATVAAVRFAYVDPWLITFGAPALFTSTCSFFDTSKVMRVVNTEHTLTHLEYDIVPYLDLITTELGNSIINGTILGTTIDLFDYLFQMAQLSASETGEYPSGPLLHPTGGFTLLPPYPMTDAPHLVQISAADATHPATNPHPSLSWYQDGLILANGPVPTVKSIISLLEASPMPKYWRKVRDIHSSGGLAGDNGFLYGTQCNQDVECLFGDCYTPQNNQNASSSSSSSSPSFCQHPASEGGNCTTASDCDSGFCVDGLCSLGWTSDFCFTAEDCQSGLCVWWRCSTGQAGSVCQSNADCLSGICQQRELQYYPLCWNTVNETVPLLPP